MFFVEVGGDDEEARGIEVVEGVVEELGPEFGAVPEVLVAEEGEVGGAGDLLEEGKLGGIEAEEGGVVVAGGPAGGGLVEFGGADIDAGEVGFDAGRREEGFEEAGFVGATAGEIEDVEVGGHEGG